MRLIKSGLKILSRIIEKKENMETYHIVIHNKEYQIISEYIHNNKQYIFETSEFLPKHVWDKLNIWDDTIVYVNPRNYEDYLMEIDVTAAKGGF